jgi:LAO/AO transport system kinase
MATRGQLGGLSRSTVDVVSVLDAAGFERIIVETVGVGQAEVDVMSAVDVVVVVSAPGLGDEVQALKAGILEIADVLVVNKADREGADRAVKDLTTMLDLAQRGRGGALRGAAGGAAPVLKTVASGGVGIAPLAQAIDAARPATPEQRTQRRRQQAEAQVLAIAGELGRQALRRLVGGRGNAGGEGGDGGADSDHAEADADGRSGSLRHLVDEVAARRCDPYAAAAELVAALAAAKP